MKKVYRILRPATLLAAMALFSGCSDEIVQPETKSTGGELLSRGAYSNPPVEWDHVENIKVVCNSHPSVTEIAVPWKSGSGQNTGIPENWNDKDLMNPDAKKRAYSRENGWIMAFQNLTDPAESNKFFGLYNRFTGVLRFFFYEMDASGNECGNNHDLGSSPCQWQHFSS